MAKSIYLDEGFRLENILSEDGFFFEMNNEYLGDDEPEYSNNIFMSNDDMIKFLNLDEFDDGKEDSDQVLTPLGVSFSNLKSNMIDILGNGMVKKFLRREGVGEKMQENALVTAKYIGYFEDQDEPFDASFNHESSSHTFQLGDGGLIEGLEIALQSMKKHEISIFLIQPEYAFGEMGCPPRIPPNQEVLFLVHVVDFKDDECTLAFNKLSLEERKSFLHIEKRAKVLIAKALDYFDKGKFKQAIKQFNSAATTLEFARLADEKEEIAQKKLLTRVYGNLAVCFNKENKPRCACTAINQIPTPNAKSHFNHGRALIRLGEFNRAIKELFKAKKMEPLNKTIDDEIKLARELDAKYKALEKCLRDNSISIIKKEKEKTEEEEEEKEVSSEFIIAAKKLCETLQVDNDVLRIVLPSILTNDERNLIMELAANNKLITVSQVRFENETVFIAKPNY